MLQKSILYKTEIPTKIGVMIAYATNEGLYSLKFADHSINEDISPSGFQILNHKNDIIISLETQLEEYFNGSRKEFSVPLVFSGTEFQNSVWKTLLNIPFGKTWTYMQQAQFIGNPKSIRAMAAANGCNKLAIIVPCHRVIGSNGKLTGYSGGLERKQFLLDLERKYSGYRDIFTKNN